MIVSDGGGGYAGTTNWYAHDVPQMWSMLEQQTTDDHWTHVAGWRKTYELASTHLYRLKEYRDRLAEAWPPTPGSASEAYVARLDGLIDHVQRTYDVAVANYDTAGAAIGAIGTARYELQQVNNEYKAKAQEKKNYDDLVASYAASQLPGTSPPPPTVTQADLDRLNAKGRSIMYGLSSELVQAQVRMQQPPPKPPKPDTGTNPGAQHPDGSGSSIPPSVPPVVPVAPSPIATGGTSGASHGGAVSGFSSGGLAAIGTGGVPGSGAWPVASVSAPVVPGGGPVLGGVGTLPPPTTPHAPGVIAPSPPMPSGPTVGPMPSVPIAPIASPGATAPPAKFGLPGPATIPGGTGGPRPVPGPMSGPRPLPPGGLIGGLPGAGLAQPSAVQPPRRINPVGGMIGGNPPTGAPAGQRPIGGARSIGGITPIGATPPTGAPAGQRPIGGARSIGGITPIGATPATGTSPGQRPAGGAGGGASRSLPTGVAGRPSGSSISGSGSSGARLPAPSVAPVGGGGVHRGAGASTGRLPQGSGSRGAVAGGAVTGTQPVGAGGIGRAAGRHEGNEGRRWDPDNPWETDEGVAPVVVPPREADRFDPGPAIGHQR